MRVHFYANRLWKDWTKKGIFLFLLFWPVFEIGYYIYCIYLGGYVYQPDFAFFLTCNSIGFGHLFQSIYFWFLPLYLLILVAEDCLEDFKTEFRNALIVRIGKKKYILNHIRKGFLTSSVTVLTGLLFNLLLVHIVFEGGVYNPYVDINYGSFFEWQVGHPLAADIVFSCAAALIAGMAASAGVMLAIVFHDRKIVYPALMVTWFVFFLQKDSIMLVFQPFSEYGIAELLPVAVTVICFYFLLSAGLYIWEVFLEKQII
ncbi:MAG: hypothetical protein PUG60_03650 [Lachnospiraceae bacterium]|nr:hypothetical protein [Lachnospiraceae bacterium]